MRAQPLHPETCVGTCLLWNYEEVLRVLQAAGNVVATLAGHTHRVRLFWLCQVYLPEQARWHPCVAVCRCWPHRMYAAWLFACLLLTVVVLSGFAFAWMRAGWLRAGRLRHPSSRM